MEFPGVDIWTLDSLRKSTTTATISAPPHRYIYAMRSILPAIALSVLLTPVHSLYFYIYGTAPKCFFEELPKDTLVVGHYTAEEWDDSTNGWAKHDGLNIFISVDVYSVEPNLNANLLTRSIYRKYSTTIIVSSRKREPHLVDSHSLPPIREITESASSLRPTAASPAGYRRVMDQVVSN